MENVVLNEQNVIPLNADTVLDVLKLSREAFTQIPEDCQFKGMDRALTPQEKKFIAIFSACATFLNQKGAMKPNTKIRIELEQVGFINPEVLPDAPEPA